MSVIVDSHYVPEYPSGIGPLKAGEQVILKFLHISTRCMVPVRFYNGNMFLLTLPPVDFRSIASMVMIGRGL
jgi:hypothetical protein